jgi:hypothetical protein
MTATKGKEGCACFSRYCSLDILFEVQIEHIFSKTVISDRPLRTMRYPAGVVPAARDSGTSTTYAGGAMRQSPR